MRKKSVKDEYDIKPSDTLAGLFVGSVNRNHQELKDNSVYRQFQNKFRDIHNIGVAKNVGAGEVLGMIVKIYGLFLDNIAYGKLDEVLKFVRETIDTKEKILYPEMYSYLLKTGYYNQSSTRITPKPMMEGFCSTVIEMMSNKRPREEFLQLGIEMSKL
jgi:hypothetical protein